ncbi:gamma carbonic anhydrase family protein [Sphingobium sp. SCG-1]|uniref:gamma carbonic anhydrase family protein n=1 Tax=Sphingobium sp. SCG-1 TaxID=2072936 RepID=UPI000CD6BBBD|nr:gamma carbonic anhydrase family protein [Sphingobium sp. SCG-1]AUW57194.1 gamma carbonic anhydrase family protein [Sphingobium sp. SCG-1]
MKQERHPGASIIALNGIAPRIHETAFIAPGCRIIGDVEIGEGASIWYNCVIRGDINQVKIGARTNIQDGTVIHCDSDKDGSGGFPTIIGADVLVGHMVMLHGCTLEDRAFAGLGTIVMDGCVIESDGMLAAGALLTPGKRLPSRQLWSGRPAKFMRDLTDEAVAGMRAGVVHYVHNAQIHKGAVNAALDE